MAASTFSRVDEYGFERSNSFNAQVYEDFMSRYLKVLAKRSKKWTDLINTTKKLKKNNRLKRYVRKGIPGEYRKQLWLLVSGAQSLRNDHSDLYELLKQQTPKQAVADSIKTDIPRTFPDNIFFNGGVELPEQLYNVLLAYAIHNTEVGYCQGLNYIVGKSDSFKYIWFEWFLEYVLKV